jgi:glycosyltransferase involved in cell wall biosynthesis
VDGRVKVDLLPRPEPALPEHAENISALRNLLVNQVNLLINQEGFSAHWLELCQKARRGTHAKLISVHHFSLYMWAESPRRGRITGMLPDRFVRWFKMWREIKIRDKVYADSDAFVLLSSRIAEQYKQLEPTRNWSKLFSIPNPLTFKLTEPISLETKRKTILFAGRMDEAQKRVSLILKLWATLCENPLAQDWNLLLVGDGPDLAKLKALAQNLPRVSFEGAQETLPYFTESSLFWMTSEKGVEGFPMVLPEALACGCVPVAMDSFLALADIVEDGQNGFVVSQNDLQAMAQKSLLLMQDEDLRKQMARNGMESCKKFSPENIVPEWEALA